MGKIEINSLLDQGSFMECGGKASPRMTGVYGNETDIPGDGVVTGYGTICGRLVYIYEQKEDILGGTVGAVHAEKIVRLYDLAMRAGAPVIGLISSSGLRLREGIWALHSFGKIYRKQLAAKAVIPQIAVVRGRCGGGMVLAAGLADFTFAGSESADLFINSPAAMGQIAGEKNLAGKHFLDGVAKEQELTEQIRTLIGILPANCRERAPEGVGEDPNRSCFGAEGAKAKGGQLIRELSDHGFFFETGAVCGEEMTTGLIYLDGRLTGCAACEGRLSAEGMDKASDLIQFCSRFHLPLLTLVNTEGFSAEPGQEERLAAAMKRLTESLISGQMPQVNVITGMAYGSAWLVMNSAALGADYTFIWEGASAGVMKGSDAVKILGSKEAADVKDMKEWAALAAAGYEKACNSAEALERTGLADKAIRPEDTRKYVIGAFETLSGGFAAIRGRS